MASRHGRRGRPAARGGAATVVSGDDGSQLLPMAVHHHEAGNLDRARVLYEQILELEPDHADALQYYGILCHQRGEPVRAAELIRRAISLKPQVAPYHDNLGTVLEGAGRLDEALAAYRQADLLEPGDADREFNLGVVLERLQRPAQAQAHYRAALALRPDDADFLFGLANALKSAGSWDEADGLYRRLMVEHPGHTGAAVNLANLLRVRGQVSESAALARQALQRAPSDAGAHYCLGCAHLQLGQMAPAQACFEAALRHAPGMWQARLGLAQALEREGKLDRAYAAYRAVVSEPEDPPEARAGLLRVARVRETRGADPVLCSVLLAALDAGRQPASAFARVLGQQLAARTGVLGAAPASDTAALALALGLTSDPLALALARALLARCVNVVPEVERWLTAARRALLLSETRDGDESTALLGLLALQCARNEYVFAVSNEEARELETLRAELERSLALGEADRLSAVEADLLCFACYTPLGDLTNAGALAKVAPGRWSESMAPVIEQVLTLPARERELALDIDTIAAGAVSDDVSQRVRAQYEENPYPRWSELAVAAWDPAQPANMMEHDLAGRWAQRPEPRILVAGCGTGQEALALAARYPRARVTGLDLSRASLAYASRMALELGMQQVAFVQGDLLDASALGTTFDMISSVGVLHHMAEPCRGLRVLAGCLAPGGCIRIGLYSARAREVVNRARARIEALGLAANAKGVRTLRTRILDGEEETLEGLLDSEDFYTTSACRDLLFHPVEHQYTLEQVAGLIAGAGLRFLSFELPHPLLRHRFDAAALGPQDDLRAWAQFEEQVPDAFEAMYVLWCRKPEATGEARDHA